MTGKELQKELIDLLRKCGWRVAHTPPVQAVTKGRDGEDVKRWMTPIQADGKGFPDLLAVRERLIVIEIKGKGDKLSGEQSVWLSAFRMAGVEAYVWTAAEWADGTCDRVIRERRRGDPIVELAVASLGALDFVEMYSDMPPEDRAHIAALAAATRANMDARASAV